MPKKGFIDSKINLSSSPLC